VEAVVCGRFTRSLRRPRAVFAPRVLDWRRPMPIRKRRLLIWLSLAILAAAGGWLLLRGGGDAPRYTTGTSDRGDVVEGGGATGTPGAVTTVQRGSQVSGTIQTLNADFNSTVKKNQVVARLDPSLFEARGGPARAHRAGGPAH